MLSFWPILSLIVMAVMVFTMRPLKGMPTARGATPRRSGPRPDNRFGGREADDRKRSEPRTRPEGKVSYRLMDEHLPTRGQRMWRGITRIFKRPASFKGQMDAERRDQPSGTRTDGQPSAELQSFLDARRRDLERRKRGPEDTLH